MFWCGFIDGGPVGCVVAERAAVAAAAQLVGLAQQMIDMSVAYVAQRQQFGKPVGSFRRHKVKSRFCCAQSVPSTGPAIR